MSRGEGLNPSTEADRRPLHSPIFTDAQRSGVIDLETYRLQIEIPGISGRRISTFVRNGVDFIAALEHHAVAIPGSRRAAQKGTESQTGKHVSRDELGKPAVYPDTDIVYIDSAPGAYLPDTHKGDFQYDPYTWLRSGDRGRVRTGVALVSEITGMRLEKPAAEVTAEDIAEHGPTLMYTATTKENELIKDLFGQLRSTNHKDRDGRDTGEPVFVIPESNIVIYDHYTGKDGSEKKIIHTGHQIEGLDLREADPRRVAIVSHPAHLLRIAHLLGHYSENIPHGTKVQAFPIPTPTAPAAHEGVRAEHRVPDSLNTAGAQYAVMELGGTAASVFSFGDAAEQMYQFYLNDTPYPVAA